MYTFELALFSTCGSVDAANRLGCWFKDRVKWNWAAGSRGAGPAVVLLMAMMLCVRPAVAVNPSLSGSLVVPFLFSPDDPNTTGDQSFWYWSGGISGGISLSVPAVMEITTSVLGNGLDWSNNNIWNLFPLDSGGLTITHSGSGSYSASVNGGSAFLNVLGLGGGPTEGTVQTRLDFTNIHGSGTQDGFGGATVFSNTVATKYNVTIPGGAQVKGNPGSNVQNLTINHNGSLIRDLFGGGSASFNLVRQNLTNHGSAELNGEVQGNFINDALPANGDVANAVHLVLDGQLLNSGELRIPNYFRTNAATSNAGLMKINGGEFNPGAAFANNGTIQYSSGTINGPGVITNHGTFQWTGEGNINAGAQIINASSAFTIVGPDSNQRYLGGIITNTGTITQSGASNLEIGGGTLNNQPGAVYDITDDSTISVGLSGGGAINNAGLFRKSGGIGISTTGGTAFHNTGTIAVTNGTLRFHGGGSLTAGTMSFSDGHTLELEYGDFPVTGTNIASGSGNLEINGGHVFAGSGVSSGFANFTGGANLLITDGLVEGKLGGTLTLNLTGSSSVQLAGPASRVGGTIGGLGSTINLGNFQWVHGTIAGNLSNASNNFTIVAGDQRIDQFAQLTNTNTVAQGDGSNLNLGGTINNESGALWTMTGTNSITNGSSTPVINNAGTWRRSGPATTTTINSALFHNLGTLAIESGKLWIVGPNVLDLTSAGTLSFRLSGQTSQVDFGIVESTHSLAAGGTLAVTLGAGFAPALGNSFDLIDWCGACNLDGSFSKLELSPLAAGLKWDASQLYTSGVLSVGVGIPGDFNQNGVVDAPDYVVWREYLGTTYTQADYSIWRSHFGQTAASGAALQPEQLKAVPETSAISLLVAGCATVAILPCRRRRLGCSFVRRTMASRVARCR